jgi:hypothetical protein
MCQKRVCFCGNVGQTGCAYLKTIQEFTRR